MRRLQLSSFIYFMLLLFSIVNGVINPFSGGIRVWREAFNKVSDELRYRKYTIDQCSDDEIFAIYHIKKQVARLRQQIETMNTNKTDNEKLRDFNQEGSLWIGNKLSCMESSLRTLQENIQNKEKEFENLIFIKQRCIQYSLSNDRVFNQVLNLIDPLDKGWKLIEYDGNYEIFRKFLGFGPSQYACIKCHGVINSSVKDVCSLLLDDKRITEYDTFYRAIKNIEKIADDTKIVWQMFPAIIFPFKQRDFCTLVHTRKLKDGSTVILSRAAKHEKVPVTSEYQRASITLAAHVIQPLKGSPNKCKLIMITQINPGGFLPPCLVNRICTLGPINSIKSIELAAKRRKSSKILRGTQKIK